MVGYEYELWDKYPIYSRGGKRCVGWFGKGRVQYIIPGRDPVVPAKGDSTVCTADGGGE